MNVSSGGEKNNTVEGYYTLLSIYKLLKDKRVTIPIIDLIYDIAVEGDNPEKLLTFLVEKDQYDIIYLEVKKYELINEKNI